MISLKDDDYLLQQLKEIVVQQKQEKEKEKLKLKTTHKDNKNLSISDISEYQIPTHPPQHQVTTRSKFHKKTSYVNIPTLTNLEEPDEPSVDMDLSTKKKKEELKKIGKRMEKIKDAITKSQNRFKLKTVTRETKFNDKIRQFKQLDTFVNVQNLLKDINPMNVKKINLPNYYASNLPKIDSLDELDEEFLETFKEAYGSRKESSFVSKKNLSDLKLEESHFSKERYIMQLPFSSKTANYLKKINNTEVFVTDEEIDKKLKLSSTMTTHLKKNLKRNTFEEFEKKLVSDFEIKEQRFLQQAQIPEVRDYEMDENDLKLRQLRKFVEVQQENEIKKKLENGEFFNRYKKESDKVLKLLKKTTQKIYSKKFVKKKEHQEELSSPRLHDQIMSSLTKGKDHSPGARFHTEKTIQEPALFVTQNSPTHHKQSLLKKRNKSTEITDFPSIKPVNVRGGNEKKISRRRRNVENQEMHIKMQIFLHSLDSVNEVFSTSRREDMKAIDLAHTIYKDLEKKKAAPMIESLKLTFEKLQPMKFAPRKNKRGNTYLNIANILSN